MSLYLKTRIQEEFKKHFTGNLYFEFTENVRLLEEICPPKICV